MPITKPQLVALLSGTLYVPERGRVVGFLHNPATQLIDNPFSAARAAAARNQPPACTSPAPPGSAAAGFFVQANRLRGGASAVHRARDEESVIEAGEGTASDSFRTFAAVASDVGYGGGSGAVNVSHIINRS